VSYDDERVLARFAKKRGIAFPLLSDPGSKTIDAYGVRNREVPDPRIEGVPHPGTFIVDRAGVIRAKLFHEGYKQRHMSEQIIEATKSLD
jgi:peroxiredoxin